MLHAAAAPSDAALLLILALAGGVPQPAIARTPPMVERCHVVPAPSAPPTRAVCALVKTPPRLRVAGFR